MAVGDRWERAKMYSMCFKCLNKGHRSCQCRETRFSGCRIEGCQDNKRRHTHLHHPKESKHNANEELNPQEVNPHATHQRGRCPPGRVALRIVPVRLVGARDQEIIINAFLDDGSDSCYISDDVAIAMELERESERHITMNTLAGASELKSRKVSVKLKSLDGKVDVLLQPWVMDSMCKGIKPIDWRRHEADWGHLKDIEFPKLPSTEVDMLIGADQPELMAAIE
ncbi:uncharacterized protein LOC141911546 [Tubulanus polymorphus]|uniref:uncharacterized protein LOC141911546 n=1 Tax=Tubulanus polymorphus TaxID=672921 RepID=UPI003DA4C792